MFLSAQKERKMFLSNEKETFKGFFLCRKKHLYPITDLKLLFLKGLAYDDFRLICGKKE
jgi:hypothetical protein